MRYFPIIVSIVLFVFCSDTRVWASSGDLGLLSKVSHGPTDTISIIVASNFQTKLNKLGSASLESIVRHHVDAETQSKKAKSQIRSFKYVSMVALRVNKQQLKLLLEDSSLDISEDKLKRASLLQSVGRVYSSQESSPFHGDNKWAVAVLDTGISKSHSFLSNKVVAEACYSNGGGLPITSSLCPGGVTSSTASNSGLPCAISGCSHGTQVAGIAAGNGPSFDGVARDAKLVSIQVYSRVNDESFCFPNASCLGAYTSDIIAGLERVYELRTTIDIASVNVSLGSDELFSGTCDDQPEKPIIDLLRAANIAVVAAVGNSADSTKMQSPACISSAFAVGATFDDNDTAWVSNNISNELDLFAPGVNINSANSNGGFSTGTGTSLAAPHVAGAWAVIRHASPSLNVGAIGSLLKRHGPTVSQHGVTRRRLNITAALNELQPGSQTGDVSNAGFLPAVIMLLLDDS